MTDLPAHLKYLEPDIEQDEYDYDAPGQNAEVVVLNGYRYTERTEHKLSLHGLKIDDASTVLVQEKFTFSSSTGSLIAIGKCGRRRVLVVVRSRLVTSKESNALFDVITGYPI